MEFLFMLIYPYFFFFYNNNTLKKYWKMCKIKIIFRVERSQKEKQSVFFYNTYNVL